MYFIAILYGILFIVYLVHEFFYIVNRNRIEIISLVRGMYSLIYGLIPCIMYGLYASGDYNIVSRLGNVEVNNALLMLLLSIAGYISLSVGYFLIVRRNRYNKKEQRQLIRIDDNKVIRITTILMVVGFIALLIWTSAYGGPSTFMKNAALIRSGYGEVFNKYAYFKHFAKFLNFAFLIIWAYLIFLIVDKRWVGLKMIILANASLLGSFIFLLCSDSRGGFGGIIISICAAMIIYRGRKKGKLARRQLIIFASVLMAGLFLTSMASEIADNFRFEDYSISSDRGNISNILIDEFGFTVITQNKTAQVLFSDEYQWKFFDEIKGSLISWIPSSLKPYKEPQTLWQYNTILCSGSLGGGTVPTDFISASLYYFHLPGPIILPFILGRLVRFIENRIYRIDSIYYKTILYYYLGYKLAMLASHYMLRSIVYENMYLVIALMLIHYVGKGRTTQRDVHQTDGIIRLKGNSINYV